MSLQAIINKSNEIQINRRRVIGVQVTRNEITKTAETPTLNTWKFSVNSSNGLPYDVARPVIETLDYQDRRMAETISFGNHPNMRWMFRYQGAMTDVDIAAITVSSFIGNQLILENLPAVDASTVLFEPNDIIQIQGYPYPFTSVNRVVRGGTASVTLTTHRPNIIGDGVIGRTIVVGTDVNFRVICVNMPTYKLVPGAMLRGSDGTLLNNARLEFTSAFELVEYTDLI
jgi:hypothetical protein